MSISTLLRRLSRGSRTSSRSSRRGPARSYRPRLEALETRQLLSSFIVVLTTDNGGQTGQRVTATAGDLRYCIEQADALHSATTDTISFSPTVFGTPQTITLNSTTRELVLNDSHPLSILGPSADTVTVSGGDAVEVLDVISGTVSISHLAVSHGNSPVDGGGISNHGTLTLTSCTLDHDRATSEGGGLANGPRGSGGTATLVRCTFNHDSAGDGGGILTFNTLTAIDCTFSNDSASAVGGGIFAVGTLTLTNCNLGNDSAADLGGGVYIHVHSTATFTNCTLSNDSATSAGGDGGGVFVNDQSTATFTNCTLSNDSAGNGGGGICTDGSGAVTLANCTLSNDSARQGGGVCVVSGGTLTATNSTFNNDVNSGVLNEGTATVAACTFSDDSALDGGGMENTSTATLTNCTFSNNSTTSNGNGGGIWNAGGATIAVTNCTIANNSAVNGSGGGIWNAGGGTLILTNTIVAENTAAVSGPDISGNVNTADHNLIGNGSGMSIVTDQGGNLIGGNGNPVIDPRLGPLQNNGGPTQTLALLKDSPAIGHADNSRAPATDQRGFTRADESGETTDIGAFEL